MKNVAAPFLKGLTATGSATVANMIFGFISLLVAVRFVPKEQFGAFIIMQAISALFMVVSELFLQPTAVTKFLAGSKADRDRRDIFWNVFFYQLLISLLLAVSVLALRPAVSALFDSPALSAIYLFAPVFFFLESIHMTLLAVLQGLHRYRALATAQGVNGAAKLLLVILLVGTLGLSMNGLIMAFLLAYTISIALQVRFAATRGSRTSFRPAFLKECIRFGFPISLNHLLSFGLKKTDRFFIGSMLSSAAVASYAAGAKLPANAMHLYTSFRAVYFPMLARLWSEDKREQADKILLHSIRMLSFFILFAAIVSYLFREEITVLLFTESYRESAPVFAFLMFGLLLTITANVYSATLIAANHPRKPVVTNITGLLFNFFGNLLLIPRFGFMGAVYSTIGSGLITYPIYLFQLRRVGISAHPIETLKPFAAAAVAIFLYEILPVDGIGLRLLAIALFLAACYGTGVVRSSDFGAVSSAFARNGSGTRKGEVTQS